MVLKFIFITGPAGSGKSTIILKYLTTNTKLPSEHDNYTLLGDAIFIGKYLTTKYYGIDTLTTQKDGRFKIQQLIKMAWLSNKSYIIYDSCYFTKSIAKLITELQQQKPREIIIDYLTIDYQTGLDRYLKRRKLASEKVYKALYSTSKKVKLLTEKYQIIHKSFTDIRDLNHLL